MFDLSPNVMISLNSWNSVIQESRFPQYQWFWRTSFVSGGVLDAYRVAGNSFILGSIEDNITRYNEYRDTRSNYMSRSYTVSSPGTWDTIASYTSRLNNYTYTGNRSARLSMDSTAGTIATLNSSIYMIYADVIVDSVTTHSYADMRITRNGTPVSCMYESLPTAGVSAWIQTSALALYDNATYRVEVRFGGSGVATIRLGYTEFIGNKNRCGALS